MSAEEHRDFYIPYNQAGPCTAKPCAGELIKDLQNGFSDEGQYLAEFLQATPPEYTEVVEEVVRKASSSNPVSPPPTSPSTISKAKASP